MIEASVSSKISAEAFRSALGSFCSGVTVVSLDTPNGVHAATVTAFSSLSLSPPMILIALDNRTRMLTHISHTSTFGISILADTQAAVSAWFAGRQTLPEPPSFQRLESVPVVAGALAALCCTRTGYFRQGDHTIVTGLLSASHVTEEEPLLYFAGRYGRFAQLAGRP